MSPRLITCTVELPGDADLSEGNPVPLTAVLAPGGVVGADPCWTGRGGKRAALDLHVLRLLETSHVGIATSITNVVKPRCFAAASGKSNCQRHHKHPARTRMSIAWHCRAPYPSPAIGRERVDSQEVNKSFRWLRWLQLTHLMVNVGGL